MIAGRATGLVELSILGAFGISVLALAWLNVRRHRGALEVERSVRPHRLPFGGTCRVDVTLTNRRPLAGPVVGLVDHLDGVPVPASLVAPVEPRGRRRTAYQFTARRRGLARLGPLRLVTVDPLGLVRAAEHLDVTVDLIVLPRIDALAPLPVVAGDGLDAGVHHRRALHTAVDEFTALRDYQPGDDIRRVHWPTTARLDRPVVRQDEQPWQRRTTVVLDLAPDPTDAAAFERAVSAAASILDLSWRQGELARLVTSEAQDSGFFDEASRLDATLDSLAMQRAGLGGSITRVVQGLAPTAGRIVVVTADPHPQRTLLSGAMPPVLVVATAASPTLDATDEHLVLVPGDDLAGPWAAYTRQLSASATATPSSAQR